MTVHILSGDLIMLKRTLQPIQSLIYGLRRYDDDRCAALIDWSKAPPGTKAQGFLSHKSKIYLVSIVPHHPVKKRKARLIDFNRLTYTIIWSIVSPALKGLLLFRRI